MTPFLGARECTQLSVPGPRADLIPSSRAGAGAPPMSGMQCPQSHHAALRRKKTACSFSRDGPKFRAGGCSPPPRPRALPWPRPRPRPPRLALPRLIPSEIVGAGGGTISARRASATAPRSAASAASTARAASSAARAASAVIASARCRARATWRRWLRDISPGMGLSGSEASRPSMARTHRWGDDSKSTTQSEWWPRSTVSGWPEKAGTARSTTTTKQALLGDRLRAGTHAPVG